MADNPAYKPQPTGYYSPPGYPSPGTPQAFGTPLTPYQSQPWEPDPAAAYQRNLNRQSAQDTQAQQAYQDQKNRQAALDQQARQAQAAAEGRAGIASEQGQQKFAYEMERSKQGDVQRQQLMDRIMRGLDAPATSFSSASGGFGAGGFGTMPPLSNPGYTPPPGVQYNTPGPVQAPDISGAQSASFGLAKAKAGSMGEAAMRGLRGNLAERGILGSGTEARGLVRNLAEATNPLAELNVAQEQERAAGLQHNQDLAQQAALAQYSGGISQRGQDISAGESAATRGLQGQLAQEQMALEAARYAQQLRQQQQNQYVGVLGGLLGAIPSY